MADYMRTKIEDRAEMFTDSRETVASYLVSGCRKLGKDVLPDGPPHLETVRGILEHVTTTRVSAAVKAKMPERNHWRFLRRPRRKDDIGRVFIHRLEWHTGRGSAGLFSLYFDRIDVGAETFDLLDTIAAVYAALFTQNGLNSSHSETWRRALGLNPGQSTFVIGADTPR